MILFDMYFVFSYLIFIISAYVTIDSIQWCALMNDMINHAGIYQSSIGLL